MEEQIVSRRGGLNTPVAASLPKHISEAFASASTNPSIRREDIQGEPKPSGCRCADRVWARAHMRSRHQYSPRSAEGFSRTPHIGYPLGLPMAVQRREAVGKD